MNVILVEETTWLGGMLSSAGVSAIDGNHFLPSGLWGEFRQKLYQYYGNPDTVKTGWVSDTLFEPHVANEIFYEMIKEYRNILLINEYWPTKVVVEKDSVRGSVFENALNKQIQIEAKISIDATEYGDFMSLAGCPFDFGRESKEQTGETFAPENADTAVQDLTYVAILQEYDDGKNHIVSKPASYNPDLFKGCCSDWSAKGDQNLVSAKKMLDYGRLPNKKYMINWPICGNDFKAPDLNCSREEREAYLQHAKEHTLSFIYFLQTQLGFETFGLADNEFSSEDNLPLIPYIRESRRIIGQEKLTLDHILDPYSAKIPPLYQQSIAVGDYPLDHHHLDKTVANSEKYPKIPAFSVPYACLVPLDKDGLLVAEKSISVSHIVNGCTRLQPVVMQIGQAAGAAAALCIKKECQPRQLNVRHLQTILLNAGVWLMPFKDITADDWVFQSMQKMACCGFIKGEGKPYKWANEFYIYPERPVSKSEFLPILYQAGGSNKEVAQLVEIDEDCTLEEAIVFIWQFLNKPVKNLSAISSLTFSNNVTFNTALTFFQKSNKLLRFKDQKHFQPDQKLTRRLMSYLIDEMFDFFV